MSKAGVKILLFFHLSTELVVPLIESRGTDDKLTSPQKNFTKNYREKDK